jgi:zinc metalloprotease ZmpB
MRNLILSLLLLSLFHTAASCQSTLYQKVSIQLANTDPNAVAEGLMMEFPSLFDGAGTKLKFFIESPGGYHFTYDQTVNGLPVYECGIKVLMNKSFRIMSVMNALKAVGQLPRGSFSITQEMAETKTRETQSPHTTQYLQEVHGAWLIEDGRLRAVYCANVSAVGQSFEIIFDGNTFAELRRLDRVVEHHAMPGGGIDTTGIGTVFNPDPLTTAGVVYGGNYVDNNDQDSPYLNDERETVTLLGINYDAGAFRLEGPHVKCEDIESPFTNPPPVLASNDFSTTRSPDQFEWVNAYYHIDTYQRYVQSLGFTTLQNNPLRVDAHGLNNADNSHFVPSGSTSYLAFGDGCVDDAEDADVIIHEYGHALSDAGSPLSNSGFERNGFDEGIGDYFCSSYSRRLNSYHWDWVFTWDGHNTCWPGRFSSVTTLYPPGSGSFYTYGEIWASTMMQFWNAEGATVADRVQLEELYMNYSSMDLHDAAWLSIDADSVLYGGVHTESLRLFFCLRGIFTGNECTVGVDEGQFSGNGWDLYPNPATDEVHLQLVSAVNAGQWTLTDLSGRVIREGSLSGQYGLIDASDLAHGTYLIQLTTENGNAGVKKLVIN